MLCRPRPSHAKPRICRHFCQWFFCFISNFISTVKFHSVRQFQSFCNFSSRCNNNTWFFLSGFYMIRTEVCRASCMRPCTAVPTRSKGGLSYDEICFRMEAVEEVQKGSQRVADWTLKWSKARMKSKKEVKAWWIGR